MIINYIQLYPIISPIILMIENPINHAYPLVVSKFATLKIAMNFRIFNR